MNTTKTYRLHAVFFALILSGCASTSRQQPVIDGPEASVRFYGNNGVGLVFFRDSECVEKDRSKGTRVSGGIGSSFGSLMGMEQNQSIGMPASKRLNDQRNGAMAREFYKEYKVAADKKLSFVMSYTGMQLSPPPGYVVNGSAPSCTIPGGTFVPQANKNYDIYLDFKTNARACLATVNEIAADGSAIPIEVHPAKSCR